MRRLTSICAAMIAALAAFAACQPEAYTGPLDYPDGSWEGIRSEYFFNGEKVADLDSCETTAISFYRQGLCCIENVKNYIANYEIGHDTFIENVDIILTDGPTSFGNGVEVAVLNETGGREVVIYDRLSAQTAYIMALYRHRPEVISRLRQMIAGHVESVTSCTGYIGSNVTIADAGYIKNVKVGDYVDVMDKEPSAALQQRPGMVDPASCLKKASPFIRNLHRHNTLTINPFLYHVSKVMDIDHSLVHT